MHLFPPPVTESIKVSPTFFLRQLQPGGPLAHRDEGHVVIHHRLVVLVVEPRQGAEPEIGFNKILYFESILAIMFGNC